MGQAGAAACELEQSIGDQSCTGFAACVEMGLPLLDRFFCFATPVDSRTTSSGSTTISAWNSSKPRRRFKTDFAATFPISDNGCRLLLTLGFLNAAAFFSPNPL